MACYMRFVIRCHPLLDMEEQRLFLIAYSNLAGALRASWRCIRSIEERSRNDPVHARHATRYRQKLEEEFHDLVMQVIETINFVLLHAERVPSLQQFMYKIRGHFYRYLGEMCTGDARQRLVRLSFESYEYASWFAGSLVTQLDMCLSLSAFYYEVMDRPMDAILLAREGFEEGLQQLVELEGDSYKTAADIMLLLRDNLCLWTGDDSLKRKLP